MSLIVQKFGGTSVADSQKILAAARKAIRAQRDGHQVVMVVSAMGKTTDMLVGLAGEITDQPAAREMDMLLSTGEQVSVALMAMAVHSLGYEAVSLTGAQIGVRTDSSHTKARINSISTERMQNLLDQGNIVIAAGFQGIDEDFNITTLGRGGSDTTAVALAAVLGADVCEIYTDVDGVYTTDPRVLPEARRVSQISYDEMLELASLGAGVMHSRSIEFAKKFGVGIHVRSSLADTEGTMILEAPESDDQAVSGAALTKNESRITVIGVPDVPGSSLEIFSQVADRKITVDMIVQNVAEEGKSDISFTVPGDELRDALDAVEIAAEKIGASGISHDDHGAKVSSVGIGMSRQAGVANRMFRALAEADVNIHMITTSEIKISVLVDRSSAQTALRAVHQTFALHEAPDQLNTGTHSRPKTNPADVATRLKGVGMENLTIDEIVLDSNQARVTIVGAPDTPGIAASVFEKVAAADIFVDMIIQSYDGHEGIATLSFTVPKDLLQKAVQVAEELAEELGCSKVTHSPDVAKLSVSGIGLRSHTDVAIRMFRALAEAQINVEMINTSELRVNVVVEGPRGEQALQQLEAAFEDVMSGN